jgi:hypothetical protein
MGKNTQEARILLFQMQRFTLMERTIQAVAISMMSAITL